MMKRNFYLIALLLIFFCHNHSTVAGWLCREASSIRSGNTLTTCGIGYGKTEGKAREDGLEKAFKELDSICSRSVDCKNQELLLEPLRNECVKDKGKFKCYRALLATITKKKKESKPIEVKKIIAQERKSEKVVTSYECGYTFSDSDMRELLQRNQITAAVKRIKKIPFKLKCSQVHYRFLNLLGKLEKYPRTYLTYLYSLVGTFSGDWRDYRPIAIFEYLHGNGDWNKKEWKLLYEAIKQGGDLEFTKYSSLLFHPKSKNQKLQLSRLKGFSTDLRNGQIGFPKPLVADRALVRLARSFDRAKAFWAIDEIFTNQLLKVEKLEKKKPSLELLGRLMKNGYSVKQREQIHKWMKVILSRPSHVRQGQEFFMSYVEELNRLFERQDQTIEEEKVIASSVSRQLDNFLKEMKSNTEDIFSSVEKKFRKKRVILFCLKNGINCSKIIPSAQALQKRLKSKKMKTVVDATEYLTLMPETTRELKKDLFALLKRKKMRRAYSKAIEALVNTPIESKKEVDILLKHAWNRVYSYEKLVEKLGKKTLVSLIPIAKDHGHSNQRLAIDMIGSLGGEGRSALEALESILKETKNYSVRDSAKEALEKIKE